MPLRSWNPKSQSKAAQSWWNDSATIYLQDEDGAYFLYGAACSEEDYNKLVPGVKLLVKGYKAEWGGEIEITDATFEIIDDGDTFIAEAKDVTAEIAKDSLINYQNQLVKFSGMTVEAYDESGAAFVYKDADQKTDDLYFKVSKDGETYEFCVEFYLCGNDTEVYKAVEALNVGDVIDAEGFLYWYNGLNPHVTRVTVVSSAPAPSDDGIMSYDEFMEAELDTEVTVDAYIQAIQEWEENAVTLYAQDPDGGGYYIPDMICYEKDAEKLAPGMKIRVTGNKAAPYKEVQIQQARYTIIDDAEPYFAEPVDVTEYLGTDDLIRYQNQVVAVKGLTIIPRGEDGGVYTYYYDNSGTDGDDMFFDSTLGDLVVNLKVESRVSSNTEVYTTVKELKVGDVIDIEGIIFWWKQPYFMVTEVKTAD